MLLRSAWRDAGESACTGKLFRLSNDIANYYGDVGSYPPMNDYWANDDAEAYPLVSRYLFNSNPDRDRASLCRRYLTCSDAHGGHYLFVTGPGTVFQSGEKISVDDITDGLSNTVMLIEGESFAPEGRSEISIDELGRIGDGGGMIAPNTAHALGRGLLFADGLVYRLVKPIREDQVRSLMTIDGKEPVTRVELEASGHLKFAGGRKRIPPK